MSRMRLFGAGLLLLLLASASTATNFVSYAGKFYISYPDTWKQVDYLSVDVFLNQGRTTKQKLEFEAAFAPSISEPWHRDIYLILTVDTISGMSPAKVDSILQGIETSFGPRQARSASAFLADIKPSQLVWDADSHTAAVVTEAATSADDKSSLLMLRFVPEGVANFYFYATDSALAAEANSVASIVASLSTEDIETAAPHESVKIADAKKIENANSEDRPIPIWAPTSGAVVVIILIAVAARRRRKKAESSSN